MVRVTLVALLWKRRAGSSRCCAAARTQHRTAHRKGSLPSHDALTVASRVQTTRVHTTCSLELQYSCTLVSAPVTLFTLSQSVHTSCAHTALCSHTRRRHMPPPCAHTSRPPHLTLSPWLPKSSQATSSQVKSSQVKSSQAKSSQVMSSQVKPSQVKSSQVKSHLTGSPWLPQPTQEAGGRRQEVGSGKQEAGSGKQEAGSRSPQEAGGRRQEVAQTIHVQCCRCCCCSLE